MTKLLDPVCGMTVDGETALRAAGYTDVAFCAPGCRTSFLKDPEAFPDRLETAGSSQSTCGCGDHHDHGQASTEHTSSGSDCCEGQAEHGHSVETKAPTIAVDVASCCGGHGG